MDNTSLAICKASNLAKRSSEKKAGDVVAAEVDAADGTAGVVGDVHGGGEEVGDGALPLPSSLSLSFTLPPSPSSWQKVGRRLAFLPTNLIKRVVTADGGGGGGGGGGGAGTGAVPTLAAAREAWCAAALALERAFAAGPRWRRRRRGLPAPGRPGAGVEEKVEVQAVGCCR